MRNDGKTMPDADPAELIVAIAARQDRAAFAELFGFYAPRIKTFLMRRGTSADVAEDLAQEALLTVWRKAAYFDPARASASAWVFAVARNLRIDTARRQQRARLYAEHENFEQEDPEQPDEILSSAERNDRVRSAMTQLPEEQVRVVQLSFFEGRAHGEIANLLGIPLGTVKSRLRLAVARLREKLGDLT
jgi:RNA polymerase sigma-70 factor (ECF subfamily)